MNKQTFLKPNIHTHPVIALLKGKVQGYFELSDISVVPRGATAKMGKKIFHVYRRDFKRNKAFIKEI